MVDSISEGKQFEGKVDHSRSSDESSPPSYSVNDPNRVPDITAAFSNLKLENTDKPTIDHCIAHLKLLQAFHQLREDVALQDGLFGLCDDFVPSTANEAQKAEILVKIREKRWAVYVARAADRFKCWHGFVDISSQKLKQEDLATVCRQKPSDGNALLFTEDNLPPLGGYYVSMMCSLCLLKLTLLTDVLMVWHAFQLNPRDFYEDCLRCGKMRLWRTGLPWAVIDPCTKNDTFEYNASDDAIDRFERILRRAWNNLDDSPEGKVGCPGCHDIHFVPWTKFDSKSAWRLWQSSSKVMGEDEATGLADKAFSLACPCGVRLNHELLRMSKFRDDLVALKIEDVPMPGTLLNWDGSFDPIK